MIEPGRSPPRMDKNVANFTRRDYTGAPPEQQPVRHAGSDRLDKYLAAVSTSIGKYHPELEGCLNTARPCVSAGARLLMCVVPLYVKLYSAAYSLCSGLPKHLLQMAFGVALCFFGGTYFMAIAAVEAWRQMGWLRSVEHIKVVHAQATTVIKRSRLDDLLDRDEDGVADVDQMDASQLAKHKVGLAMETVTEPQRLQEAVGGLWASYVAVIATLSVRFAQTTAMALGLVECVKLPVARLLAPLLGELLGPKKAHWARTIIESALGIIAMAFAWYLQMIISAFYSAIRGGMLFAEGLFDALNDRGLIKYLPCVPLPYDPDLTFVDEAVGYTLAAGGFAFQLTTGFSLPFPANLLLLPLTLVEWILRFQVGGQAVHGSAGVVAG